MKKVLIIFALLLAVFALAILSPWDAIIEKTLSIVGLTLKPPVTISVTSKSGDLLVFLNGETKGTTPIEIGSLQGGKYTIKLQREAATENAYAVFERVFDIEPGTEMVINWELGPSSEFSSGEILFLKKRLDAGTATTSTISVISYPEDSVVYFNNARQDGPPFIVNDVTEGKHKVKVQKDGYLDSEVAVETKAGYDLFMEVRLFPIPVDIYKE